MDKLSYILSKSSLSYFSYTSIQIQKILCSACFNRLIKLTFFRCILERSCFLLIKLNPHEIQVHSYSYGSKVFRLQCPQCFPNFCQIFHLLTVAVIMLYIIELNINLS